MREEKQLLLDEIREQVEHYGSFVIMRYFGLNASTAGDLRDKVAELGGNVEMVRKRVLVKAAHEAGILLDLDQLPGHIGLVFGGADPIETAKTIFDFSKSNENVLEVIGGRFDGQLYTGTEVEKLSKLPSKDEMRSQLLSVLVAPMTETLAVCQSILTAVLYCLENKSQQEG